MQAVIRRGTEDKSIRLRDHPKIAWSPEWPEWGARSPVAEIGTLKEIDLTEKDQAGPRWLLLAGEFKGKVRFAELTCDNAAFIRRLYGMIKPW